jgi:hypothetical protein
MVLTNFSAKIVKGETLVKENGNPEIYYHIEGIAHDGTSLKPIRLSMDEFDNKKWFRTSWGGKAVLNDVDFYKKASKLLGLAIYELSQPFPSVSVYDQMGIKDQLLGDPKFIFGNGSITSKGIDKTSYSTLPERLSYVRLPEHLPDDEQIKEAVKTVFELLNFSENNSNIGLIICLAAIRASISMFLPIDHWIFLVGQKGTFKSSIARIMMSFFGSTTKYTSLISWESTICVLESFLHHANNGLICVDDFVYPPKSNRKHEFNTKAEQILRASSNGSQKSRTKNQGSSVENKSGLNCMLISTGEFVPPSVADSLHTRGIYIPFNVGDVNRQKLKELQKFAKDGTFVSVNMVFIQYLLNDYQKNSAKALEWFDAASESYKKSFDLTDRAVSHMAGLAVGWVFFLKFAVGMGVITSDESKTYQKQVKNSLGKLMEEQESIYSPDVGKIFVSGLRCAFQEGRAHLIDSQTGKRPLKAEPSKVGWHDKKSKSLCVGWRDTKTGWVYINGDIDVDDLIALMPEQHRQLFPSGPKTFWKFIKSQNRLKCPENDRNTTRIQLAGASTNNHYHLKMKIADMLCQTALKTFHNLPGKIVEKFPVVM